MLRGAQKLVGAVVQRTGRKDKERTERYEKRPVRILGKTVAETDTAPIAIGDKNLCTT
jgi:hypothetical protein